MSETLYPTLWPEGFNPDDTEPLAMAAVVDQTNPAADRRTLHRHLTGQLTLADAGLVGVEFTTGLWIAPVHCGVWIPPDTPHNGVLGTDAKSVSLHIAPRAAAQLPAEPVRFLLNPMTTAMVRHLAVRRPPKARSEAIARVILDELLEARHLPVNTAPFPNDERLQHIALTCTDRATVAFTNADWAAKEAMSERTLTRLVKKETGLSLADWILSIRLLGAVNGLMAGATVEETAWNAGYENPSAFIRRFRRQFGMTPGLFRNEQTA